MADKFTLIGKEMDDGRTYITSRDLPGFRLIVENAENAESEIVSALREFYPLYKAAEAKKQAQKQTPHLGKLTERRHEVEYSAEFAFA